MSAEVAAAQRLVLDLCREQPEGLPEGEILSHLKPKGTSFVVDILNKLLSAHRVQCFTRANGSRVYKATDEGEASKKRGLSEEEVLVYQEISNSATKGVWVKDIRRKTGLAINAVNKALKNLDQRELIKSVKAVQHGNRKHYMLFELEPSQEITGGIWYEGAEFDSAIVDTIYNLCLKCIEDRRQATAEDICEFVNSTGALAVKMQQDEIDKVVAALLYDCRIQVASGTSPVAYQPAKRRRTASAFASVPCGVCPVINECTPDGHISPSTCVYFDEWLDF